MNRVALVTGGAKGIGREIVLELAKAGCDIVVNYNTSKEEALALKEEVLNMGQRCLIFKADISKENEIDAMFEVIENVFVGVDILVNNAAIDLSNLFSLQTKEEFSRTIDVNNIGTYMVTKRAYKHMINNKWGRIINISSTNGINTCYPDSMFYDASKAALISMTHNMAIAFSPYVTVNAVAPGFIGTEAELLGYDPEFLKSECEKILVKRYGNPNEVAKLVRFLASDDASYINNSVIRIDGGQFNS